MAYITATIRQIDPANAQDQTRLVVEFTGNAGEPTVRRERYVTGDDTNQTLRDWARFEALRLTGRKSIADGLTVGQSITLTAPPGPTQAEIDRAAWVDKARRLAQLKQLGTVSPSTLATEIAALETDVRQSYQTGWVGSV